MRLKPIEYYVLFALCAAMLMLDVYRHDWTSTSLLLLGYIAGRIWSWYE